MKTQPLHLEPTRRAGQRGYLLIEALVYIAVIVALLGVAYAAMYRCIDRSIALRRNADDITSALHAGERWRADVRAATSRDPLGKHRCRPASPPRRPGQGRHLSLCHQCRLPPDRRGSLGACPAQCEILHHDRRPARIRHRLALGARNPAAHHGSVKPGRVRPLFTFLAVPERPHPNETAFLSRITFHASRFTPPASPVRLRRHRHHGAPGHHSHLRGRQSPDPHQPRPRTATARTPANPPPPGRRPEDQFAARYHHQHQRHLSAPHELNNHQRPLPSRTPITYQLSTINIRQCPASSSSNSR